MEVVAEGSDDELGAGVGAGLGDELVEDDNSLAVEPDLDGDRRLRRPAGFEPWKEAAGLRCGRFRGDQVGKRLSLVGGPDAVEDDLALAGLLAGRSRGEGAVQGGVEPKRDPAHSPLGAGRGFPAGLLCCRPDGTSGCWPAGRSLVTAAGAVSADAIGPGVAWTVGCDRVGGGAVEDAAD